MAKNQHDNIQSLKARVTQLEAEIQWMRPGPRESYTAWVERLFHSVRKVA